MKAPKIEFPCDYPIKIMGEAHGLFRETVLAVVSKYDAEYDPGRVTERASSGGKYVSLTVFITATGEDQLKKLFEDLKATGMVRMVL